MAKNTKQQGYRTKWFKCGVEINILIHGIKKFDEVLQNLKSDFREVNSQVPYTNQRHLIARDLHRKIQKAQKSRTSLKTKLKDLKAVKNSVYVI
jgi:CCR4-NOT transcriptional regulation complex NOT5 subunit